VRVQPVRVQEKEMVQFAAILQPAGPEARYRFILGDGKDTGWITVSKVSHRYQQPGQYIATAYARPGNDNLLKSRNVLVKVVPLSYRLHLVADKSRVKPGEAVTFFSSLEPKTSGARYRCLLGDEQASPVLANPRMIHRCERMAIPPFRACYNGSCLMKRNSLSKQLSPKRMEGK